MIRFARRLATQRPFPVSSVARRLLAAVLLTSLVACGGFAGWFGPTFDNAAACRMYVDTYNHLECLPEGGRLGADVCPAWLDRTGCDLTEYYACLTQGAVCRDGVPRVASRAECGDTACD